MLPTRFFAYWGSRFAISESEFTQCEPDGCCVLERFLFCDRRNVFLEGCYVLPDIRTFCSRLNAARDVIGEPFEVRVAADEHDTLNRRHAISFFVSTRIPIVVVAGDLVFGGRRPAAPPP